MLLHELIVNGSFGLPGIVNQTFCTPYPLKSDSSERTKQKPEQQYRATFKLKLL